MDILSFLLVVAFCSFPSVLSLDNNNNNNNITINFLETYFQESALNTFVIRHRPHTGSVYKAILPSNFSGINVSFVRIRSKKLWKEGIDLGEFISIPSKTRAVPHVKRLLIVYQNFGNWSSSLFDITQNYSLLTPVIGFTVYDASNVRAKNTSRISLNATHKPISIRFQDSRNASSSLSGERCASFSANGSVSFSELSPANTCHSTDQGRFSIVAIKLVSTGTKGKKGKEWESSQIAGLVLGISGLIVVCYVVVVLLRLSKSKKVQVMERQADEGELFETKWIGGSKMPSATAVRTQPVLENGAFA